MSSESVEVEKASRDFICPITQELMEKPVYIQETGNLYEKSAIEKYFAVQRQAGRPLKDPLTNAVLEVTPPVLVPFSELKSTIMNTVRDQQKVFRVLNQEQKNKLFWNACRKGDRQTVALALKYGAQIDSKSKLKGDEGRTGLHIAVKSCESRIVEFLLVREAKINIRCDNKAALLPIFSAAANKNSKILKMLLGAGADPNETTSDRRDSRNALHYAALYGCSDNVALLLDCGKKVPIEATDKNHMTALHCAVQYNSKNNSQEALLLLLKRGANVDARTISKWTPLHVAVVRKNKYAVERLIEFGADTQAKTDGGCTALQFVDRKSPLADLIRRLEAQRNISMRKVPYRLSRVVGYCEALEKKIVILKAEIDTLKAEVVKLKSIKKSSEGTEQVKLRNDDSGPRLRFSL